MMQWCIDSSWCRKKCSNIFYWWTDSSVQISPLGPGLLKSELFFLMFLTDIFKIEPSSKVAHMECTAIELSWILQLFYNGYPTCQSILLLIPWFLLLALRELGLLGQAALSGRAHFKVGEDNVKFCSVRFHCTMLVPQPQARVPYITFPSYY